MSDPEHFLTRWSRLKRQGGEAGEREPAEAEPRAHPAEHASSAPPAQSRAASQPADRPPAFDPASLPAIESITATTDIRPFLAPGVPAALTRAALRRAWASDPRIRDFIEIAENQWDFATPDSVPGFAAFRSGEDISRFVAQLGHSPRKDAETSPADGARGDMTPSPDPAPSRDIEPGPPALAAVQPKDETPVVQGDENRARDRQTKAEPRLAERPARRSHGRALPH